MQWLGAGRCRHRELGREQVWGQKAVWTGSGFSAPSVPLLVPGPAQVGILPAPHCTVGSQPAEQHSGAPPGGKPCLCTPRPLPFSAAATGDTGLCRDHAHATLLQYCCYEDVFQNGRCYSVVHPLQYLGHNLSLWCCVHTGEAALQGSPPSSRRQSLGVCAPRVRGPLYSYFEGFFKIFLLIFMKSEEVFFRKSTAISDSHY